MFTRDPTLPSELWPGFSAKYGKYLTPVQGISSAPLSADELSAQSKRAWSGGAAGLDGWRPAELKHLPKAAWRERSKVEALFVAISALPDIYYDVPITMFKKGDDLTPLQRRGISVFAALYRLTTRAWWHRIMPGCINWVHPDASGGLPDRECLESAWDARARIEYATLTGKKVAAVLMDYDIFSIVSIAIFSRPFLMQLGCPLRLAHSSDPCTSTYAAGSKSLGMSIHQCPLTAVRAKVILSPSWAPSPLPRLSSAC